MGLICARQDKAGDTSAENRCKSWSNHTSVRGLFSGPIGKRTQEIEVLSPTTIEARIEHERSGLLSERLAIK